MAYTTAEGRQTVLQDVAFATRSLGEALQWLSEAYEHVDEDAGDRLEASLFRPVQAALAAAKRTHAEFAGRYGLSRPPDEGPIQQGRPLGPREALERAVQSLNETDERLSELQDSMLPVEVGDPQLRAGLTQIRELIAPLPAGASELLRTLGR